MKCNSISVHITLALTTLLATGVMVFDWDGANHASAAAAPVGTVDGLRCEITSCDSKLVIGAPFMLAAVIKNVSDHEIAIPNRMFRSSARIIMTSANGKTVIDRNAMIVCGLSPTLALANMVILKPGEVHKLKYTTHLLNHATDIMWSQTRWVYPLTAGKHQIQFRYSASYRLTPESSSLSEPKFWQGSLVSVPVDVSVASLSAQETVVHMIAKVKSSNDADFRKVLMHAITLITCRLYGGNDGEQKSLELLESWWAANKKASGQEWIVASLGSENAEERKLAAERVKRVTDSKLHKKLLGLLASRHPEVSDKVFEALWTTSEDTEALEYARGLLKSREHARRFKALMMIRRFKIEPLQKECQSAFLTWLETEKDNKNLGQLIRVAGDSKVRESIPILEELDRKNQGPFKELIIALTYLKHVDYEPRLIEHLSGKDDEQRIWATWCLRRYGTRASLGPLIQRLWDSNVKARSNACWVLGYRPWKTQVNRDSPPTRNPTITKDQYVTTVNRMIELLATDEKIMRGTISAALGRIIGGRAPGETRDRDRKVAAEAWRRYAGLEKP